MPDSQERKHNGLTRRQWLLRLGETAVLIGFSGAADELEGHTGVALFESAAEALRLPPGLYLPSEDDLTHALMSDEPFHSFPPGSETDYTRPRTGPFVPQFFSADQFVVVRRLVGLFLGSSKSLMGTADGKGVRLTDEVAEWIDLIVFNATSVRDAVRHLAPEHRVIADRYHGPEAMRELETADPQKVWREGLEWLAEESQQRFGKSFQSLPEPLQLELLRATSDDRPDKDGQNNGTRLFEFLKTQALHGFYTSRQGLTELDYKGNAYHTECPGCSTNHS